jgi:methionine aminopeptidase
VIKDGYHGDELDVQVGKPLDPGQAPVGITYEAMWRGIRASGPARICDVGSTISAPFAGNTLSVVREFTGTASAASSTKSRRCSTTEGRAAQSLEQG